MPALRRGGAGQRDHAFAADRGQGDLDRCATDLVGDGILRSLHVPQPA